ncbi:hypothetical protein BS333_15205 [Vibrio azureus]|uniref:Uncharacterized protein n=1 Tax=Vibrio azureus NBRC 104587 TaxID=1219077 RepID=U3CE49_9VIBR|nr:hypothetical protein [Vibrio azureus]AUI87748.1 hypothetical protein BS333_15205 [Vibrio azureus]GAD76598.1 hypothetical protein VAZ01S_048_00040 [Vibrio azureus NBRC 104587]
MNTLNYPSISRQQWQQLTQMIESKFAIVIDSEQGQAKSNGFRFSWAYNSQQQALELICNEKPIFVPYTLIKHQVDSLVSQL